MIPHAIQPREYSKGGGTDDNAYAPQLGRQPLRPVPVLERRTVGLEQQLAGQQLELQQPRGGSRNSHHFFSACAGGEFCFSN